MSRQIKSKERVVKYGEVFTAEREVNAMLDLVNEECKRIDSRFLEPACGDGNFLAEILRRKLKTAKWYANDPTEYWDWSVRAIESLYGIDIQRDNVEATRERLWNIWFSAYEAPDCELQERVSDALKRNIVCGDFLTKTTSDGESIWFLE